MRSCKVERWQVFVADRHTKEVATVLTALELFLHSLLIALSRVGPSCIGRHRPTRAIETAAQRGDMLCNLRGRHGRTVKTGNFLGNQPDENTTALINQDLHQGLIWAQDFPDFLDC